MGEREDDPSTEDLIRAARERLAESQQPRHEPDETELDEASNAGQTAPETTPAARPDAGDPPAAWSVLIRP